MSKKKQSPKFSPKGFWLSPKGAVVPVQIHAEALMLIPRAFGLDRAPHGRDEVNAAMAKVIKAGWMRGRMVSPGNFSFQVERASGGTVGAIYDYLVDRVGAAHVTIQTIKPPETRQIMFYAAHKLSGN